MHHSISHSRFTLCMLVAALALTGCNRTSVPGTAAELTSADGHIQGRAMGGQQPINGATVQLWAVGTTDGGAATPLLTSTVTTSDGTGLANSNANAGNANNTLAPGYFDITGRYTCPTPGTLVYLTATGGNPGLANGANNTAAVNVDAIGTCNYLQTGVQFLSVNELTTVGAIRALYPYTTNYTAIGAANQTALATAFNLSMEYVNFQNGQAPGPNLPAGKYASTTDVNALSNAIAACVNTTGGTYNDGSVCGQLFFYTKPASSPSATDTVGALRYIFQNPSNNVANIFNLQAPAAPFMPVPSTPPADFSLPILTQPGTPMFSVSGQSVSITDSDTAAVLYYTLDGSTPTTSSSVYSTPITISSTTTLKALAVDGGRAFSDVATATYFIAQPQAATPTFSPAGGTFTVAQTVQITSGTAGAAIYYTTDGSTPTTASALYTSGGINVSQTETVNAIAVLSGYANSAVGSAAYTLNIPSGTISTIAGTGVINFCCDGSAATDAELYQPRGVAVDSSGNLYIADASNQRIRKVTASTGIITTVAGTGTAGFSGDGGPATSATLSYPYGVAVDGSGNLLIADSSNQRIRKVTVSTGIITTVAGTGTEGFSGDGGAATSAALDTPSGVAVDASGNLYIADYSNNRIRKVTASTGIIATVTGTGTAGFSGDGGAATSAKINFPYGVALDASGNFYIADSRNNRIRKVTASTGIITTVAGTGTAGYTATQDGGLATSATLNSPDGLAVDASGNLYIVDPNNQRIRKVSTSGVITTVAGNGTGGFSGDGGQATSAALYYPFGVAVDASGNIYIGDTSNQRTRKVSMSGIITTVAGNGNAAYSAGQDGHIATAAQLYNPSSVAVDASGNLYIADASNQRIRKISTSGVITTLAGNGTAGYTAAQDGGPATSASLNSPRGVAIDGSGNLYIADSNNQRIRKVTASTGIITTVAGTGTGSFSGDGGAATSATLFYPYGVAVDASGNLYIGDTSNNRIRKVTASTGIITTVVGTGTGSFSGDGGAATSASLYQPYGVAVDGSGNLYIADTSNQRVRKVTVSTGIITTVAGTGTAGYSAAQDGGPAISATLNSPRGVAVDGSGNLYIADLSNQRVRKVTP